MCNRRQDRWIGLNGPRGCETGVAVTIGFQSRIFFKRLLECSLAEDLLIRHMQKTLSHEFLDVFQLFHEVISKYFAHISWRNKHVGEDGFARASLLHNSLQAFKLRKTLEFIVLRDGEGAITLIFLEDGVLVD